MSRGTSTVSVVGQVHTTSSAIALAWALNEAISEVASAQGSLLLEADDTDVDVPLGLPAGVTEVVWLMLKSEKKLVLEIETSDASASVKIGLLGTTILSMHPGQGVKSIRATNPDNTNSKELFYAYAFLASPSDDPPFYRVP